LPETFRNCKCHFNITKLRFQQDTRIIRFLQEESQNNITAISEVFLALIDKTAIDGENGETEPIGPVAENPTSPFIYWGNQTCFLMAAIRTTTDEEEINFWKYLEGTKVL
jgi:hypothetical protein